MLDKHAHTVRQALYACTLGQTQIGRQPFAIDQFIGQAAGSKDRGIDRWQLADQSGRGRIDDDIELLVDEIRRLLAALGGKA